MNTIYGHNLILRRYCGVIWPYLVPGLIEHGWEPGFMPHIDHSQVDAKTKQTLQLVWNKRNYDQAVAYGYNVALTGSPMIYLPEKQLRKPVPNSLLLFPFHSLVEEPFVDPVGIFRRYIDGVCLILDNFDEVVVCLHWNDYQDGLVRSLFKDQGIGVVTVGHPDTTNFLDRFCRLVSIFDYVCCPQLSTCAVYSLYLGKKVFIYEERLEVSDYNVILPQGRHIAQEISRNSHKWYPELSWDKFGHKAHKEIGDFEVGADWKKSPRELREILHWEPQFLTGQITRIALRKGARYGLWLPEPVKKPLRKVLGYE